MSERPASALSATPPPPEDLSALTRAGLITAIGNAIEFARLSQRFVGLLMVQLVRPDKLEAIVGMATHEVMKHAIRRLPGALRPVDRAVSVTEDKIIVLLPNLKSTAQAWLAAGKVQRVLEEGFSVDGEMVSVRPVVGIATFPDHAELAEELIVHADIAVGIATMRDVAQHVFQKADRRDSDAYLGLEAPLREAIRLNQLQLYFQPQVDLASGKARAAEALLRWSAPDIGTISPATVVRIAEASGIIGSLTAWVVNATLRQKAEWVKRGLGFDVSVNLSTVNLTDAELPDAVRQALGTWGVDPATVTFEITESATIGDAERSTNVLNGLKALGVKLAVDDFGTGYSSLSYLKNFPLDELKIDKLFIQQLQMSSADQRIVKSVVALAHDFGLKVVAEGVEDDATARELKRMRCDMAQGYAYSPALPAAQFAEWFQKHS
jgi:EAL domain-containing protein (putative c-di-GMP-specific phosphodiesterase class I)/GGDEF domain-containing protein